jgi:hypothetical protein
MQRLGAECSIAVTTIFNIWFRWVGCGRSCIKISGTGIRFSFSLHHSRRDKVGGFGNVDRHPCREHHPVPCLHEAGVWSICSPADGVPDSAIRCRLLPGRGWGGNDARAARGWIACRGSGRDAPAAARSIILTDDGIAGWCAGWKRPIIDFVWL